ncbi:hypothetical protein CEXT_340871, partial [Caerostris extrusa]
MNGTEAKTDLTSNGNIGLRNGGLESDLVSHNTVVGNGGKK